MKPIQITFTSEHGRETINIMADEKNLDSLLLWVQEHAHAVEIDGQVINLHDFYMSEKSDRYLAKYF